MKKILAIPVAVLIIFIIFFSIQNMTKRFNVAKENNVSQDETAIDSDPLVLGKSQEINLPTGEEDKNIQDDTSPEPTKTITETLPEQALETPPPVETEKQVGAYSPHPTIKIKIVKQPQGEEPDWVNQAWIGLEIPVVINNYEQKRGEEVISGILRPTLKYMVPVETALNILKAKNPDAEKWWRSNVNLTSVDGLGFDQEVCELIGAE